MAHACKNLTQIAFDDDDESFVAELVQQLEKAAGV